MAQPTRRPHSRKTSTSSTSSTYRLFPRCPKTTTTPSPPPTACRHTRHTSISLDASCLPVHPTSAALTPSFSTITQQRRHTLPAPSLLQDISTHHLTTSIERSTIPVLAHLTAQLPLVQAGRDRVRVQSMIQRQASVLVLSQLLRGWDGEEDELECGMGEEQSWDSESESEFEVWEDAMEVAA